MTNWGGRLVSVMVPDKNGKMTDVVLGYDNIQQYVDNPNNNYGGLIGRLWKPYCKWQVYAGWC